MRIEILDSPNTDGTQDVRGTIEDSADGLICSDGEMESLAASFRRQLSVKIGSVKPVNGVPQLVGPLPSPADTVRYILASDMIKGRVREAAPSPE